MNIWIVRKLAGLRQTRLNSRSQAAKKARQRRDHQGMGHHGGAYAAGPDCARGHGTRPSVPAIITHCQLGKWRNQEVYSGRRGLR